MSRRGSRSARLLLAAVLLAVALVAPRSAPPAAANGLLPPTTTIFLLTSGDQLVAVDTALPAQPASPVAITGVTAGETLIGIDVRPQNATLYALGVNATANTASLYVVNPFSGFAGLVGTAGAIAFTTDGATVVDLPDPALVGYGMDFNPSADRLRVVAGSLNFRANPNTGAPVDGDNGGGVVSGFNPDGPINAGTTSVDSTAYSNSQPNTTVTTQYTLDATSNSLFIQSPPNAGTQTQGQSVTLGGNPLDFTGLSGFDIPPGVNAPSSNSAVSSGSAYAALTVGGTAGLYSIDLVNATATLLGSPGLTGVVGLAVWSPGQPAIGLNSGSTALVRFSLANPGTSTSVTIGLIIGGEILAGIDGRPQTGQLFGLGVNAAANTASLYLLDPQTGAVTAIGTPGQIAFVDAAGNPVDLPDPVTVGYGIDFNPTVDRLRVTTGSGLNFRVNPITGAPVDGNLNNSASPPAGTNPDGPIDGLPAGSIGVSAAAYTNNYAQSLTGGTTTQYTLDATSDSLFIQNPPNAGTQTSALTVTLAGAPLDFNNTAGFDIPPGASVAASGSAASGNAYASLVVGSVNNIYRIALGSGAATLLGAAPVVLTNLTVWAEPPTATLAAASTTVSEGAGTVEVTVGATGGTPMVASYTLVPGSATAGSDYTAASGTLLLGGTTLTRTISLSILDDSAIEVGETFELQLRGPGEVGQSLTFTIADNDQPTAAFSGAAFTGSEISGTATLTVTLSEAAVVTTTVSYATADGSAIAGSDYTTTTGTLSFPAGQTSGTITVPILKDGVFDPGATFTVTLSAPGGLTLGTPSTATVTIIEDSLQRRLWLPMLRR